jgi:UDP-2,4-diacetamido-2,4,6-trideoxy-beta-L-altropyranose hydrolase
MVFMFRADASTDIGSGHVTRCASLARALVKVGHEVEFVCRKLEGDLSHWLEAEGFRVTQILDGTSTAIMELQDARATTDSVQGRHYDWIIVDHYGLGVPWERAATIMADHLFVLDDLGRHHDCDILLDQNYVNPTHALYAARVSSDCQLLLGSQFALLRPEFAQLRAKSLARDRKHIARVLVNMGGSDPCNETSKVLVGLARLTRDQPYVDVVIGAGNPHRNAVETACAELQHVDLHVQTARMAELMVAADCAICATGNTTWERCALGLPALVTILADNQMATAEALDAAGAQQLLGWQHQLVPDDYARALLALDSQKLRRMSAAAAKICDGEGVERVAKYLYANRTVQGEPSEKFTPNAQGRRF